MSKIRWLHLSDLHVGAAGKPLLHHSFSKLEADIHEHVRAGCTAPDLILFTGDLAFSGQRAQYEAVNRYLDCIRGWLRDAWKGCDPLLFAVPGNHDLIRPEYDRGEDEGAEAHEDRLDWYDECLKRYEEGASHKQKRLRKMWSDGQDRKLEPNLARPFRHYSEWARTHVYERLKGDPRCKHVHASFFPGDLSAVIEKDGFRLGLVGLNSSWVQYSGDEFKGKLQLPVEQFHAALRADEGAPLDFFKECHRALLLMHHPYDWLTERAQKDFHQLIYDPSYFVACLYGHMHASRGETRSESGGPMRVYMQAPSLFGLEHYGSTEKEQDRAFGYAWGEICRDGSLRIWPRQLSLDKDGDVWQFERDRRASYQGGNEWYWLREPQRRDMTADAAPGLVESRTGEDYARHLPAYAAWARKRYELLDMAGLGGGALRLRLEDVFVPLRFHPRRAGTENPRAGVMVGSPPDRDVLLEEVFACAEPARHLFVLGDPGAGKTTALKQLLWSCLTEDGGADGTKVGLEARTVPVFIRLRQVDAALRRKSMVELLEAHLEGLHGEPRVAAVETRRDHGGHGAGSTEEAPSLPSGFARWLWERGRLLLLFDGLDEIADPSEREMACEYIEKNLSLAEREGRPGIRAVVSCRFAAARGNVGFGPSFAYLDIRPMNDEQIERLLKGWFAAAEEAVSRSQGGEESAGRAAGVRRGAELAAVLRREEYASQRLRTLVANPLLLTLLCVVVFDGREIPRQRADFFHDCLRTLMRRWTRGFAAAAEERPLLDLSTALRLLRPVAWEMHANNQKIDLARADLHRAMGPELQRLQETQNVTFGTIVDWLCRHTGIMTEFAPGEYGFMHLNLQEYLVALHAASAPERCLSWLAQKFGETSWREVILLLCAVDESQHFGPLMERVLATPGKLEGGEQSEKLLRECLNEASGPDCEAFARVIENPRESVARRKAALRLFVRRADGRVRAAAQEVLAEAPEDEELMALAVEAAERRVAYQVFISHASRDIEAVEKLTAELEGQNIRVWRPAKARDGHRGWTEGLEETLGQVGSLVIAIGSGGVAEPEELREVQQEFMDRKLPARVLLLPGAEEQRSLPSFLQEVACSDMRTGVNATVVSELAVAIGGREAGQGKAAPLFVEATTNMRFLWVPGGRFWMGSGEEETDAYEDEKPRHLVEISGYWLAETPVTNGQYEVFLRARPGMEEPRMWRDRRYNQAEQPVVGVSWVEAREFCRWLSEVSGKKMELPTEAQWERAARGEDGRKYPWGGEEPDGTRAHYGKEWEDAPLPVGSLPAGKGPYGHLDLAGNVWEWCRDALEEDAYKERGELTVNPGESEAGDGDGDPGEARACRGGAFRLGRRGLRSACRSGYHADDGDHDLGFRVAALPASR